ncbi:MAG: hypothetical protein IJU41_08075 [Clostridia bacterium]|nr:hypothetical protein [Clostridia bacterium]
MSGPKTSKYTLTEEQRRILAQQRELARRKSVARGRIEQAQSRLRQICGGFAGDKEIAGELLGANADDGGFSKAMTQLEAAVAAANALIAKTDPEDVPALESAAASLAAEARRIEKKVGKMADTAAANAQRLTAKLHRAIDRAAETSFADLADARTEKTAGARESLRRKLIAAKGGTLLPAELTAELDHALSCLDTIDNEGFLKTFSSVTVSPILKRCQRYREEYEICHVEFEERLAEYNALCALYGYVAQPYTCSAAAIETLKGEIARITAAAAEDDEQAYISRALDEVMEEMGYTVIGSREVTKKNGAHFKNELFTYGEGTAVNVTYAADGRIAMELGGVDTKDRLPSAEESAALSESMVRFCGDFHEIERRLGARGVVLADRLSMLPPGAEYAQIINTSDYQMTGDLPTLQIRRRKGSSAAGKKRVKEE